MGGRDLRQWARDEALAARGISSTFHFPEMMLNVITNSVSDSLAILRQAQDGVCPEYKVVSCRIRKARKTHLREAGEVVAKA